MDRRQFLKQAGLSLGAFSATAWAQANQAPAPASKKGREPVDTPDWAWVRDQFPLSRSYVHMAAFTLASHPRPVADAIARYRAAFDENPTDFWHDHRLEADQRCRAAAAEYMGGHADQIALTDSTTMGLGLLYGSLRLAPGDEILTTTHDHYATQMALKHRADRTGATIREVTLYDAPAEASVDEILSRTRKAITKHTRVLAVTWVHSSSGVKLPVAAMAAALAEVNASRDPDERLLLCVDGVHGLGVENVCVPDLGCDFFVAGTHKWLFGPRGTGVIWGRPHAWKRASPIIPSFGRNEGVWLGRRKADEVSTGELMSPGGFHSFEHRWALDEAFRFHLRIGKSRIQERIHALNTIAKEALAGLPHVKVHTPRSAQLSAGIICFEVAGRSADDVVAHLHRRGIIASASPYRVSYSRIAPCLVNNQEEIERTMRALRELA